MNLSIDVFNSRAPVWMASDFGRKMSGEYIADFLPVGGIYCFDGMVIADHLPTSANEYQPLIELVHANTNARFGLVSAGPDIGCIYSE